MKTEITKEQEKKSLRYVCKNCGAVNYPLKEIRKCFSCKSKNIVLDIK